MKCKACGKLVEFPIYEEEVIIQSQPLLGPNGFSTTPTGRTIPVCHFCNLSLHDEAEINEGWVRGPKPYATEIYEKQLYRRNSKAKGVES